MSAVNFVFFFILFLSLFSYVFQINFEYISSLADATKATVYVTLLIAITLVVAFTVATLISHLLFASSSKASSAHIILEQKLDGLATDDSAPLDDIELAPSAHLPQTLVDSLNSFLARIRSQLDKLRARVATITRRHTASIAAQAKYDSDHSALIGELSHRLQTSLSSLTGYINAAIVESQTQNTNPGKLRRCLTDAYRNTVRLTDDAKVMLTFSSTDLRLPLRELEFDFENLVQECISATQISCDISTNSINCSHTGPLKIRADRMRLKHILESLLIHAHKACHHGHVSVVSIVSNDLLLLSVRDTGPGISENDLSEAFDIQANRRPDERDSGLSLFICKSWVESLSGAVVARSEQGKSTTFQITVPISIAA